MAQITKLSERPGRAGAITKINGDGSLEQGVVGFFPESLDAFATNPAVNQLRGIFTSAVRTIQTYHQIHEAALLAKASNRPVSLPPLEQRQAEARRHQNELIRLEQQISVLAAQAYDRKTELRQQVVSPPSTPTGHARQAELRQFLRTADPQARLDLIQNRRVFRESALSAEPELSGLSQPMHQLLTDEDVRQQFPGPISELEALSEGLEVVSGALKTANQAVTNELLATGTSVVEPVAPAPVKAWV